MLDQARGTALCYFSLEDHPPAPPLDPTWKYSWMTHGPRTNLGQTWSNHHHQIQVLWKSVEFLMTFDDFIISSANIYFSVPGRKHGHEKGKPWKMIEGWTRSGHLLEGNSDRNQQKPSDSSAKMNANSTGKHRFSMVFHRFSIGFP